MRDFVFRAINALDHMGAKIDRRRPALDVGLRINMAAAAVGIAGEALERCCHQDYRERSGLVRAVHAMAHELVSGIPGPIVSKIEAGAWLDLCVDILVAITDRLPADVGSSGSPETIELLGEIGDPSRLILDIIGLCRSSLVDSWADVIDANARKHAKVDLDDGDLPVALISKILRGTPLMRALKIPVSLVIPEDAECCDTVIVGPRGSGKSRLVHSMVSRMIARKCGVLLIDSQLDFADELLEHCDLDTEDIVYINPSDPRFRPKINLAAMGAQFPVFLEYLMAAMAMEMSAPQRGLIRYLGQIIEHMHEPTLADVSRLLVGDIDGPVSKIMPQLPQLLRDWVMQHWDDPLYKESRNALDRRLFDLRASKELGGMFDSAETNFELGKALNSGKLVILILDQTKLGKETPVVATVFLIFALLAMYARNPRAKLRGVRIILDELRDMLPKGALEVLKKIAAQGRKYRFGMVMAFQVWSQVSGELKDSLRTSAVKICARMDGADATDMADRMKCDRELLRSLRRVPGSHGQLAITVEDRFHEAVIVTVPFDLKRTKHGRTREEMDQLMDQLAEPWGHVEIHPANVIKMRKPKWAANG